MRSKIILAFILIIATVLRFWQLGVVPPSLTWDEAAWGYNSYSLGVDGKDEFGRFLPLDYLESFGDFKPPMYAYLGIIPVKLFGLNEFATRFPSAFFGVLTVLITYLLTKQIFYNSKRKEIYALVAAGILAISPWHIMLSRAAFEANVATFFLSSGVWLFLRGVNGKSLSYIWSMAMFVFSIYTFNSARVVAPLLVFTFVIIFHKTLWQQKKQFIIACFIGLLLFLPTAKFLTTPQASLRFKEVNIFTDDTVVKTSNQEIANDNNSVFSKIIHNRRVLYTLSFFKHYFDNLNPSFLFIKGDGNPKFSTQDVGQMYLWDLPFFVLGIFCLFKNKEGRWYVVPLWLLLGIIPAATARETPHALRIEATLPTFQILVAYGVVQVVSYLKYKRLVSSILLALLLGNIVYFLHGYYVHYSREYSGEWQYGYKDVITYVNFNKNQYSTIRMTTALGRPYVYFLFYLKTPPQDFRKTATVHRDAFGFVDVLGFDKYSFTKDVNIPSEKNALYINIPDQIPGNAKVMQLFPLMNGKPSLEAYIQ